MSLNVACGFLSAEALAKAVSRTVVAASLAITIVVALNASEGSVADAAKARDVATVRTLLKQGADVNAAQGDGMTALHWAASLGDPALTQMLLSAGANLRATMRLGGLTALHMASQAGHAQVVAALIASGAEPNLATATGATALMLAARSGSVETATRLVETGADVNRAEKAFGQTALMVAAGLDRADVVRLLLARGADWKAASSVADLKALTAPAEQEGRPQAPAGGGGSRIDVAGVTRGYRYNELIGAQGGLTALHFAARQGSANAARALVEGGVDVNQCSARSRIPKRSSTWTASAPSTITNVYLASSECRVQSAELEILLTLNSEL